MPLKMNGRTQGGDGTREDEQEGRRERGRKGGREGATNLQVHGAREDTPPFLPLVQVEAPGVVQGVFPVALFKEAAIEVELPKGSERGREGSKKETA